MQDLSFQTIRRREMYVGTEERCPPIACRPCCGSHVSPDDTVPEDALVHKDEIVHPHALAIIFIPLLHIYVTCISVELETSLGTGLQYSILAQSSYV